MEGFEKPKKFGPYRLHSKVAEGGMAEVFLATAEREDLQGQFLAVKKLHERLNANKPFVNLLIHEAKIGVLLNHPGIVTVYDLGSYQSEFFLTMEYIHGKSLDRLFKKIEAGDAPKLPLEISSYIILELLRGLSFAHQLKDVKGRPLNIIHRDVSPGNILLGYRGEVKLTDFGIATAENRLQQGFSKSALGKLAYIAPEQAVNDPVVRASDLYSLCVVYYQLLTGQLPFSANNQEELYKKVIAGKMTDLKITGPALDQILREIVTKCLDKSPSKRFSSGPELFQALLDFFKAEYELDFSSRVVRKYYQKKLAEYLRAVFEDEMIQEMQIIKEALTSKEEAEDFKKTQEDPQPAFEQMDEDEATVFQADLTDELTRHYTLSKDEREKMLQGLEPHEALGRSATDDLETAERPNPQKIENREESDAEEANAESFSRLNFEKKLEASSLSRDQKEYLQDNAPSQEIMSADELNAFEKSTFSGQKIYGPEDDPSDSTRQMDRKAFLQEIEKIKAKKERGELEETEDSLDEFSGKTIMLDQATMKLPEEQKQTEKVKVPKRLRRKLKLPHLNWRPLQSQAKAFFYVHKETIKRSGLILGVGILLGAAGIYLQDYFQNRSIRGNFIPTQKVSLSFIGEAKPADQERFLKSLDRPGNSRSLGSIEAMFNREYERYQGSSRSNALSLIYHDPKPVSRSLSKQPDIGQLLGTDRIFKFFEEIGFSMASGIDAQIFVYLYPYDPNANDNPQFPTEFQGKRYPRQGVVFARAHPSDKINTLMAIAREIGYLYGANDKRDQFTKMPLIPEGIANPQETPLYPQSRAELMGRDIPLDPLKKRTVLGMNEVAIGPVTAYELGWITKSKMSELLEGAPGTDSTPPKKAAPPTDRDP